MHTEVQAFMQLGLPAIQHIMSESSSLGLHGGGNGCDSAMDHAATSARHATAAAATPRQLTPLRR